MSVCSAGQQQQRQQRRAAVRYRHGGVKSECKEQVTSVKSGMEFGIGVGAISACPPGRSCAAGTELVI